MTKVIIVGQAQGAEPVKKKIEFKYFITGLGCNVAVFPPANFKVVELISMGYDYAPGDQIRIIYDLMFAYDDDRNDGTLYLGHFNDGVV